MQCKTNDMAAPWQSTCGDSLRRFGFLERKCKIHLFLNVYFVFQLNEQCSPQIKGLHLVLLTLTNSVMDTCRFHSQCLILSQLLRADADFDVVHCWTRMMKRNYSKTASNTFKVHFSMNGLVAFVFLRTQVCLRNKGHNEVIIPSSI